MFGRKFHYGWIVVGTTCVALLTAAGVRSTPGILMVPLEQEFHWSRATIGFSVSINLILYGCIGPFAAAVMERFGVRRSVVCALILVAVGVAYTVAGMQRGMALSISNVQILVAHGRLRSRHRAGRNYPGILQMVACGRLRENACRYYACL